MNLHETVAQRMDAVCGRHGRLLLVLVFVLSVLGQAAALHFVQPGISIAAANGVSAALGWRHGDGMTVTGPEAQSIRGATPGANLLTLYADDADRTPAQEPLPALVFLYAGFAAAFGSLSRSMLVWPQILVHALAAALLGWELMKRSPLAGILAATAWAVWAPAIRMSLLVGYDTYTGSLTLFVIVACLAGLRRRSWTLMLLAGILAGAGLWLRSYFILVPAAVGVLLLLAPVTWRQRAAFIVPVVLLFFLLRDFRSSPGFQSQATRGGFWHTFWAGVGQFDNDVGVQNLDGSVRELAERLEPGRSFAFHDYQYDAQYNEALRGLGREWIKSNPHLLLRNGIYRLGWLAVPGAMPMKSQALRLVYALATAVVTVLAVIGFLDLWRRDRWTGILLSAAWLSLTPLAAYYLIAKVPAVVYFAPLSLAAFGVVRLARGREAAP